MRIAVTTAIARVGGGAETYLEAVLPALQASGHQLALLCEHEGPVSRRRIVDSAQIPLWCAETIGESAAMRHLADWRPEVIFAQGLRSAEFEARTAAIAPLVSMVHDYRGGCISGSKTYHWPRLKSCSRTLGPACLAHFYPHRCGGLNPLTMLRDYRKELRRLGILRASATVVTVSEHMREEYRKCGLDADRIRCAGFPLRALGHGWPAPPPLADATRLPSRLLFAGRFEYLKGAAVLLEAMPLAAAALDRKLSLTLAGDGRMSESLEVQAGRLTAIEPLLSITFRGWLEADQMQVEYRSADLLVMPSLWPEPFGLAGPEAALYGVPAAAFATGGIPEWLSDGVNGSLAPANPPTAQGLANAIIECLRDPDRHHRMRAAAIAMASRFSPERHIGKLNQVFLEVAARRQPLTASN